MKEKTHVILKGLFLILAISFIASFTLAQNVNAEGEAQRRLMARRAAKVDALRNLTEQVYGVRIDSHTLVRDFVTQSDTVRAKLDAVIQGAKEIDYIEKPDGTAEVTVEITLDRVRDILGRRLDYEYQTFTAIGYGAPSGSASGYSAPVSVSSVIRAKGNGVEPNDPSMSTAERGLMAKRAAKLDALRNLTEQVYGLRIASDSYVRNFVTQSDEMRARVHVFIQGSRVVSERPLGDGSYEVEVEIDTDPIIKMFR